MKSRKKSSRFRDVNAKQKGLRCGIYLLLLLSCAACSTTAKRKPATPSGAAAELKHCLQLSAQKKQTEAVNCLEAFKSRYPDSEAAAEADLLIADSYFRKKDYLLAAESYNDFIKEYPHAPKLDYAYYKAAQSYFLDTPKVIGRDQQYLDLAAQNLSLLIDAFPSSPYYKLAQQFALQVRTKQAKKDYSIAKFYYNFKEYRACVPRFAEIVDKYGGTIYDPPSFYYSIVAYKKLKEKEKARGALNLFEQRYPKSRWLHRARGLLSNKN